MGIDPDKDVVYFARTDYRNANRLYGIKRKDRRQHFYIIGKTGTGKSALENNMIVQDIANGEGVCVVDPHGELVEGILKMIPEERMDDVVYFNPADTDYHIGFNILELPDPKYKHLVASGLMGIFTKIWAGVWSARMEYILNNAILALLDNPGSTLLGVPRLLVDKEYRQKIIGHVTDPVVKAFWVNEYEQWKDQFRNEAIAPIQNKVGQFLSTALIRNIVGQAKSTIDIFELMNSGKIFLVNVSKGRIGEDNSALLGAMIITKIQLAAMERVRVPEEERVDFYLYVDEFQNFATDSFAGILSEARKYRLNLIIAHQYIGQLVNDQSTKVRDAVFGNVGTMVIFRVGAGDAEFLEKEFAPEFVPEDLVNLPNHHIYIKLMVDGVTCRPFSSATLPPFKLHSSSASEEKLIQNSQKRYARPNYLVEEEINKWSGVMEMAEPVREGQFPATCAVCGKSFGLPFEPTGNRPVYCRECLAKVKSGEIPPAPRIRLPVMRETVSPSRYSELAEMGIEFQASAPIAKPARERTPRPASPEQTVSESDRGESRLRQERTSPPPGRTEPREPARTRETDRRSAPSHPPAGLPVPGRAEPLENAPEGSLSLSALTPSEKSPKQKPVKPEVDLDELRESISESLRRASQSDSDEPSK